MSGEEFAGIAKAVEEIKRGRMIVVVDDESRENEGDLVMGASAATPEAVNFMASHGRGLICVPLERKRLQNLGLRPMERRNSSEAEFTVSCDASTGVTTGISAADRARTIKLLSDPACGSEDISTPGHVFPIAYREGGVLVRAGHTEASVDLARMAGLFPAGVICEIMNEDGTMARLKELKKFVARHGLLLITIADLIKYRSRNEKLVKCTESANLPTEYGEFQLHHYQSVVDTSDSHIALVKGDVKGAADVPVRVHSQCMTGDILGSKRCDCGQQLHKALKLIGRSEKGVFLYMGHEGRGIGLGNKIRAYCLQDGGLDTVEANHALGFRTDLRDYGLGAQILSDLGLSSIKLLTNNPRKIVGLDGYGLKVTGRIPLTTEENPHNRRYLKTKKDKMGHYLD